MRRQHSSWLLAFQLHLLLGILLAHLALPAPAARQLAPPPGGEAAVQVATRPRPVEAEPLPELPPVSPTRPVDRAAPPAVAPRVEAETLLAARPEAAPQRAGVEPEPEPLELEAAVAAAVGVEQGAVLAQPLRVAYPASCRRHGHQDLVILEVVVDAAGRPGEITVLQAAGCPRLTREAVAAARRARFLPAAQFGQAVADLAVLRIRFQLVGEELARL